MLSNGLTVMVVSDLDVDKAAASLSIRVGSGDDPADRPGLAHFLEHLLFLGTKKYPLAGEFDQYLTEHGGHSNAWTSFDLTNYFFSVDPSYLPGALDRFAQFFMSPTFDQQYIESERQVVHSEYVSTLQEDSEQYWAAFQQVLEPDHPWANFITGNADTLADRPGSDIRSELIQFYKNKYSAHLMKLVVAGRDSLDVLEREVRSRFAAIPRTSYNPPIITTPLYRRDLLPALLEIEPIKEKFSIDISFAIPSLHPYSQALELVSFLIQHEGAGGLLAHLKAKGYAVGIYAGATLMHQDFAEYSISIDATPEGIDHRDDVVAMVFAYLELIRQKGIQLHYHQENAQMARLNFLYQEKEEPEALVDGIASRLHIYPLEKVLSAPFRYGDFDPVVEEYFLSLLVPRWALVTVVDKRVTTDATAPYYNTPYRLSTIPSQTIALWENAQPEKSFVLPATNPFIPTKLDMIPTQDTTAGIKRIVEKPGFELWHHADVEFAQPRTHFYFSIRSAEAGRSPRHRVLQSLLVGMIHDVLAEYSYPADLAGQTYELYSHGRGLSFRLEGWSDKQDRLLDHILATLKNLPLPEHRFKIQKSELLRELRNSDKNSSPMEKALEELEMLLTEPYHSAEARIKELGTVEWEDLRRYAKDFFRRGEVIALAHGNITAADAEKLGERLEPGLIGSMQVASIPTNNRTLLLPSGTQYIRWVEGHHQDHALVLYRQGRSGDYKEKAKIILLAQMVEELFFYELRTQREIGYDVWAGSYTLSGIPGLAFAVRSSSKSPEEIYREIDAFIHRFSATLKKMTPEVFQRHRSAIASYWRAGQKNLTERTDFYWTSINHPDRYPFDRHEQVVKELGGLTQGELMDAWEELVVSPTSARGLITTVSAGEEVALDQAIPVEGQLP